MQITIFCDSSKTRITKNALADNSLVGDDTGVTINATTPDTLVVFDVCRALASYGVKFNLQYCDDESIIYVQ